jgi:hypothetical protein
VATRGSPQNETSIRCKLDAILLTTLAATKKDEHEQTSSQDSMDSQGSFNSLHWQFEQQVSLPWKYYKREVRITGFTDYSLWYGDPNNQETNLVIVEAKKFGGGAGSFQQLLSYMGEYILQSIIYIYLLLNSSQR